VVVAHNEQFGLQKCLNSIAALELENCEIICVDSGSTDSTLAVAKHFNGVIDNLKIISVTGHQNAAIARNAGLGYVTKEIIFFIDGDVEINAEFIEKSLDYIESGRSEAVVGILEEYQYSDNFEKIIKKIDNRTSIFKEEKRYLCGGIFMVKSSVINDIGKFDPKFKKSQDYDFTLRLTKRYNLLAITSSMGIHHTIPYSNADRLHVELKSSLPVFYGMVIRKNISNYIGCFSYIYKIGYLKSIVVYLLFACSIFLHQFLYIAFFVLILDFISGLKKKQNLKYRFLSHYLFPLYMFYGLIFNLNPKITDDTKINIIL
jgi:glycosyltransferase involved in cell wall biosynthesis